MNYWELEKKLSDFRSSVNLEKIISHDTRYVVRRILLIVLLIVFVMTSGILWNSSRAMTGVFFLLLFVYLIFVALDAYYYSFFFASDKKEEDFELASVIFETKPFDATGGFIKSKYGFGALIRSGIDPDDLTEFLSSKKIFVNTKSLVLSDLEKDTTTQSYISSLVEHDKEFENFLFAHNLNDEILAKSLIWVSDLERRRVGRQRWWDEKRMSLIEPIGRGWAYGRAYKLQKWSIPLRFSRGITNELHSEEVNTLETILSKSEKANVLVIGEEGSGKMEVVEGLARRIERKLSVPALRDKEFRVLLTEALMSANDSRGGFERSLMDILSETSKAGNIVLVIPDMASLIAGAHAFEADISAILSPFLASADINIIGINDSESYHSIVEKEAEIIERFETVLIKGSDRNSILALLLDEVIYLESQEAVMFTYPAVEEAVSSAERYFVGEPVYNRAKDLLVESVSHAREQRKSLVLQEDILSLVAKRTGVPMGEISSSEKNLLENLEDLLHHRIVGQNEAVQLISNALRRARSGIGNPDRPIGSFLFIGPTGVGKTETAKALGEMFFGQKSKILRLDMSEYNSVDSLSRLIGGFDIDTPGILSSLLSENKYGVLLLDELEKTNSAVLDLFLQILDEGIFSDVSGRKISARNLIIVATSNAGSDIIFESMQKGENLLEKKEKIVSEIVKDKIFKPELINRFDGVILFHPLSDEHLRKVATLLLKRLEWRLKEKGITLVINDDLLDFLVSKGNDPKFGARPLNRVIQDNVEKIIADRIISGELRSGSTVELSQKDLEK